MEIIAKSTFVRQTPRKIRLVADQIRGLKAIEAVKILENLNKKAARFLLRVLKQGIANAENNFNLKKENLKIKKLEINEAPRMKRYHFVAKGRVHQILKRMSHIKMILEEINQENKAEVKIENRSKNRSLRGGKSQERTQKKGGKNGTKG